MTFTFSSTDLSTDLAKVRVRIGDTKSAAMLLTDEEINAALTASSTVLAATVACVKLILAAIARDVDANAGGISTSRSQKTTHYRDLLRDLEAEMRAGASPYLGGVSKAEKTSRESNTDFALPSFSVGRDDYP